MKFVVQIAETENYEIEVEADDEASAEQAAMRIWRTALDVGGYQIADTTTEIVAVTAQPADGGK